MRICAKRRKIMLHAKDFRDRARSHLGPGWTSKKWGTFAVIALIYSAIEAVVSFLGYIFYIVYIAQLIILGPFALGFAIVSTDIVRGNGNPQVQSFFGGFKNFGSAFLLNLLNAIFVFLWSLLLIIPGIIKAYAYSMSFYILRDNPEMSAGDARRASIEMMQGNKWRYFCLMFSFIGWYLLSILTFGILFFWIIPYTETAKAEFYESLKQRSLLEEIPA